MEPGAYVFRNLATNMLVGGEPLFQTPVTLVHGPPDPIILHAIDESAFFMLPSRPPTDQPLHLGCENDENSPVMFRPEPCAWVLAPGPIPDSYSVRCQNADLCWTGPEGPANECPIILQKHNGNPAQFWRLERAGY